MHPMNTLDQRMKTNALVVGDIVKAQAEQPLDRDPHGDWVDYAVTMVCPSPYPKDPDYSPRVVIERYDSEGKRHCHFIMHTRLKFD